MMSLTFLLNLVVVGERRIICIRLGYECDLKAMEISEFFGSCEIDGVARE